jgi:hypothetical protein
MPTVDLTEVINDSISDAELVDPIETTDPIEPEVVEETAAPEVQPEQTVTEPEAAVPAPAKPEVDEFEKKWGIPALSASGRENRLPHSRVKKMVEKADKDAYTRGRTELETEYKPKYETLEKENADFKSRFEQVAQFEQIMMNEQPRFVQMLLNVPGYREIFQSLLQQAAPSAPEQPEAPAINPDAEMPLPNHELPDGSRVYDIDGLKSLMTWQAQSVEKRLRTEFEKQYGPLRQSYDEYQRRSAAMPAVQRQISEARQWEGFNDNEDEIVKALAANQTWSLERAYQHVVLPKLKADRERLANEGKVNRDAVRAEILAELKKAPKSTSAPASPTKVTAPVQTGPRDLKDVIAQSLADKGINLGRD